MGLFGGPPSLRGFGQTIPPGNAGSASPSVTLPSTGGNLSQSDPDGAKGDYGPASIFAGIWPLDVAAAPPLGPISVSSNGTTGASGSVTSSTSIVEYATPVPVRCFGDPVGTTNCTVPGGIGPGPVEADEIHSTCAANESGLTGSTTVVNGKVLIADSDTDAVGEPGEVAIVPPTSPPPGTEYAGVVGNVNDYFTVVFNEHVLTPDSITVNAMHIYLEGPTGR